MEKKDSNQKTNSEYFSLIFESADITAEEINKLSTTITLREFLREMSRRGLEVKVTAKKTAEPAAEPAEPTEEEIEEVVLTHEVADTPEHRAGYLKMLKKAKEKLRDSGIIQAYLEEEHAVRHTPLDEAAMEKLNAASLQGDFGDLRDLSKDLKKDT